MEYNDLNFNSPHSISNYLDSKGMKPLKRFGQNYMVDPSARQKIVDAVLSHEPDEIWEFGPGLGAITAQLAQSAAALTVFEIDKGYADILEDHYGTRIRVVRGDGVKMVGKVERQQPGKLVVCGNLPYNSAGAMIENSLSLVPMARAIYGTVQREAAWRMAGKVGEKNYSSFSVFCQLRAVIHQLFDLGPESFYPRPEVTSSFVELKPRSDRDPAVLAWAEALSTALFSSRRKTIANNIKNSKLAESPGTEPLLAMFAECGIEAKERAERVSPEQFYTVAQSLYQSQGSL